MSVDTLVADVIIDDAWERGVLSVRFSGVEQKKHMVDSGIEKARDGTDPYVAMRDELDR